MGNTFLKCLCCFGTLPNENLDTTPALYMSRVGRIGVTVLSPTLFAALDEGFVKRAVSIFATLKGQPLGAARSLVGIPSPLVSWPWHKGNRAPLASGGGLHPGQLQSRGSHAAWRAAGRRRVAAQQPLECGSTCAALGFIGMFAFLRSHHW